MLGLIWRADHLEYLGWAEYLLRWMNEPLPFGWEIISKPEEIAEIIEGKFVDRKDIPHDLHLRIPPFNHRCRLIEQ